MTQVRSTASRLLVACGVVLAALTVSVLAYPSGAAIAVDEVPSPSPTSDPAPSASPSIAPTESPRPTASAPAPTPASTLVAPAPAPQSTRAPAGGGNVVVTPSQAPASPAPTLAPAVTPTATPSTTPTPSSSPTAPAVLSENSSSSGGFDATPFLILGGIVLVGGGVGIFFVARQFVTAQGGRNDPPPFDPRVPEIDDAERTAWLAPGLFEVPGTATPPSPADGHPLDQA